MKYIINSKIVNKFMLYSNNLLIINLLEEIFGIKMPLVGQRRPALPRTYSAVPSALGGLTSGFGMGPGVPPLPWSLTNKGYSTVKGVSFVP